MTRIVDLARAAQLLDIDLPTATLAVLDGDLAAELASIKLSTC
jgi:hypothetical protein